MYQKHHCHYHEFMEYEKRGLEVKDLDGFSNSLQFSFYLPKQ